MEFTAENKRHFDELVARYPSRRAAILPALWLAQRQEGHISAEAMEYIAGLLQVPPADVQAVVSFYTMYDRTPPGRYKLQVCHTLSCAIMGAYDLLRHLEHRLGIHHGQTTPDGMFTLQEVECLGSCGTAPMMQVNEKYYENLTLAAVDALLDRLARDEPELDRLPEIHELAGAQAAIPREVRAELPPSARSIPLEGLAPAHGGAPLDLADPRVGELGPAAGLASTSGDGRRAPGEAEAR
jgi:NADH-quinone oxidoreductase subunit E